MASVETLIKKPALACTVQPVKLPVYYKKISDLSQYTFAAIYIYLINILKQIPQCLF